MTASVTTLRTRKDRLRADQAAELRSLIQSRPDLPERAAGEIIAAIDRETATNERWPFVMVSPDDHMRVMCWLRDHSKRPWVGVMVWNECFRHLRRDTGEIVRTTRELAEAVGAHPDDVRRVLVELAGEGAIRVEREKVPGRRTPGPARYFMSPRIGTHTTGVARDAAQAEAPVLRLVP